MKNLNKKLGIIVRCTISLHLYISLCLLDEQVNIFQCKMHQYLTYLHTAKQRRPGNFLTFNCSYNE